MESRTESLAGMPKSVLKGIERFVSEMETAFGDRLLSIVVYGGLAKGEYSPKDSDVNVMVVLDTVDVEALDAAAPLVRRYSRTLRLAVLFLSETDLRRSTDVFPVKFLDMQEHHRLLSGRDVLQDLEVSDEHLRLRSEQELKNLLLRLRNVYLLRAHDSKQVAATLSGAVSAFVVSLGAILRLKGTASPKLKRDVVSAAAEELGLEREPLEQTLALKEGRYRPDAAALRRLYGSFMAAVGKAAEVVDEL